MTDLSKMSLAELKALRARVAGTSTSVPVTSAGPGAAPFPVLSKEQQRRDAQRMDASREAAEGGASASALAGQIEELIHKNRTGPIYGLPGASLMNADIQSINRLGQEGVFPNLSKLKGPLSDKDIAFLKSQQVSSTNWGPENQRIVDLMKWASARAIAHDSALQAWKKRLGSPSATNARGETFQDWWFGYADKNMPRPSVYQGTKNAEPQGRIVARRPAQ